MLVGCLHVSCLIHCQCLLARVVVCLLCKRHSRLPCESVPPPYVIFCNATPITIHSQLVLCVDNYRPYSRSWFVRLLHLPLPAKYACLWMLFYLCQHIGPSRSGRGHTIFQHHYTFPGTHGGSVCRQCGAACVLLCTSDPAIHHRTCCFSRSLVFPATEHLPHRQRMFCTSSSLPKAFWCTRSCSPRNAAKQK